MTTIKIRVCILLIGLVLVQGCEKTDREVPSANDAVDIISPQLYQGTELLADALAFIEVPEDRMESSLESVSRRGKLPDAQQLAFANKLFSLHESRDVELFRSLLSDGTRKELDGPDTNKQLVRLGMRQVENGTFLYKEGDDKFLVTLAVISPEDLESISRNLSFADQPTHTISFYRFYRPKYMLIGTQSYLVQDGDSYRLLAGTLLKGELPPPVEEEDSNEPKVYGIASFEQNDEAYTDEFAYRYRWAVELTLEESENNAFEIIKLTNVIAGEDPNFPPEIAEDVLIEEAIFSKYGYRELKFSFRVGDESPREGFSRHGRRLSGWGYGFSIASTGRSTSMLFPGTDMTNIQARTEGGFVGSDLELLSFETTSGDIRYRHRVVLRKTPIAETSNP